MHAENRNLIRAEQSCRQEAVSKKLLNNCPLIGSWTMTSQAAPAPALSLGDYYKDGQGGGAGRAIEERVVIASHGSLKSDRRRHKGTKLSIIAETSVRLKRERESKA